MRAMILIATLLACTGSAVHAQSKPNERKGFWFGFGLGGGSLGADCSDCDNERTTGGSGYIRLGGTISRSFLLGFETNVWLHSTDVTFSDGSTTTLNNPLGWSLSPRVPEREGRHHLKFGLGGMTYTAALEDGSGGPHGDGAGFLHWRRVRFRVGRNMSLVPM
jgi:hypothetical protein